MGKLTEIAISRTAAPRVLVLGSCILDLQFFVDRLPKHGESLPARSGDRRLGGKGFNQAVALARLGCDVTFVSGVGDDETARLFDARAKHEGIDFRPAVISSESTGVAAPLITPDGVSTIVVNVGASLQLDARHVDAVLNARKWDVALCHYEVPSICLRRLFDGCEALGVPVVCNPAPWMFGDGLTFAREADVVVLNAVEAQSLAREAGFDTYALPSVQALAQACAETCKGELLVMTLGREGAVAVGDHITSTCEAFAVDAVDSTGAGDAFCAGLAYGLVCGWSRARALVLASATAALACTQRGGADAMPSLASANGLAATHALWSVG